MFLYLYGGLIFLLLCYSEDDDLKKALALSKNEEQERQKNLDKYNNMSNNNEDWDDKAG